MSAEQHHRLWLTLWAVAITCAAPLEATASGATCAREVCVQKDSKRFDEKRCVAESPWMIEGDVERVVTETAKQRHPFTGDLVMMTTVTGIYLRNTRMVKGVLPITYLAGNERVRIPYHGCGMRFEPAWVGRKVRIYGRAEPSTGPQLIVPHHNYVLPLPYGTE